MTHQIQESDCPIALRARIAVERRCPSIMAWHLAQVLEGEYESGYVGEDLGYST